MDFVRFLHAMSSSDGTNEPREIPTDGGTLQWVAHTTSRNRVMIIWTDHSPSFTEQRERDARTELRTRIERFHAKIEW